MKLSIATPRYLLKLSLSSHSTSAIEPQEGLMEQILVNTGYYHGDLVGNMSVGVEITLGEGEHKK
jgi:hypothetical protein